MRYQEITSEPDDGLTPDSRKALATIRDLFEKRFGKPIGYGRNREVFSNGRTVFKLPRNDAGFRDKSMEYHHFRRWKDEAQARCRIIFIMNIPVLLMELVKMIPVDEKLPDWTDFIDCRQVGRRKDGKIVAYDYA